MKRTDFLSATALSLLIATPAFAQDSAPDAPAVQEDYDSANDIVVTATRRNETVQEVPIAITAVGTELLENAGVQDIRGLEQLAPSLQTTTGQSSATGSSIFIRGVGTAGDNPGFEPAVGVFIDGVFRARAGVALAELPELERVEVLRGPQGTLFGRNTSAGALSIFTAQPKFELGGYIEGTYGNYDQYIVKGAITGPVAEALALRVDAGYRKRDGYIEDSNSDRAINNIDRYYVRGQALYDTSTFSFRLIGDYYETDEECCGAVNITPGQFAPIVEGLAGARGRDGLYTGPPSDRTQAISPERGYGEAVKDWGFSGEFNIDIGDNKLTSITAYRNWRVLRDQDIDFSGLDRAYREDYRNELKDFTQEIRFQGSAFGGVLDFLVGGFYLNETNTLRDTVRFGTDANQYVDSIFNAALRPLFGTPVSFYGSLGPTVPTFGQVLANPAAPPAAYGALAPLVTAYRGALATVPGLAALSLAPLPRAAAGQGNNNDDFRVKTDAFAIFTHNIINVTDDLSITLGARYNYERKTLDASINNNTGSCGFFDQVRAGNPAANVYANILRGAGLFNNLFLLSCNPAVNNEFNGVYNDRRSDSQITGTAKLAYKFTPDILGYASYDRGFKSGGYNLDQATFDSVLLGGNGPQAEDLEFGKEVVDSFEVGFKASFTRKFTLNVAAFYQKFQDLQTLIFSGNNFVVLNVPDGSGRGVEAEAIFQPVRELIIRTGYTYLDASFDESNNFTGTPLQGLEGEQFLNQPRNVVTVATTWTPALGSSGYQALLHADMRYNSAVNIAGTPPDVNGRTLVRNPGYPLVNARIGIQSEDRQRSVEFFVENVFDQYYNITGFPVPEQTGTTAGYPGLPRFYGVRTRIGF
ncbi:MULTISPECIES: TonB-dependent receptor [unclassified Sphingomonas]|uniref:TonB-dependent receptor n=1 Tax=unclassified Sphingomonas TaxID=196159 RepID=UPI0008320E9F|nr:MULTISPECIES: TonB-dependent receptor [unclassified Sphingomonas]